MTRIHRLPEAVARKIAAGEVIERPASVVKELVENALDAGARSIRVELQDGGKSLVRVQDDGAGMGREDALLSFERHATSKLGDESDLERIATLGFRGEALASIAAVSRVVLKTSDGSGPSGTAVEREGGESAGVSEIACPRGTSVEVRDLFFNLPARRKFLKSGPSELAVVVKQLTLVALAHPGVGFRVVHGKREVLNAPAVAGLRERVFQLFGKEVLDRLVEADFAEGGGRLTGLASRPPRGKADRARQFFFVNARPVRDRLLQAALAQAYRGLLERDSYPEAFLYLEIPFAEVDVNVHPAKSEVRFKDSQKVFALVVHGLEASLRSGPRIKDVVPEGTPPPGRPWPPRVEDGRPASLFAAPEPGAGGPAETRSPRVLGQYLLTYIVATADEGVYIIDQHNAHERILFDRFREVRARGPLPRKAALLPILVELSPAQMLSLEEGRPSLDEGGFRVEEMGGRTIVLKEYPDLFEPDTAKEAFLAVLDEMEAGRTEDRRDRILATLACKSAVKAGEPLPREKMEYLTAELFRHEDKALCPHGRPILILIERGQVEKSLKRQPH
jgi:DNA mismatch repair protein MutL